MTYPKPSTADLFTSALGQTPLTEVEPNSVDILVDERLNEIFNTPPGELSDDDLAKIVMYFRQNRAAFIEQEAKKAAELPKTRKKPGATAKAPKSVAEAISNFGDLL